MAFCIVIYFAYGEINVLSVDDLRRYLGFLEHAGLHHTQGEGVTMDEYGNK